ncbi:MAG TPA: hypothetical protein VFA07_05735 [Chthonomonadaceae bacterium]|nr:hypothetical protein [Chthonomonadaceae bacterium]
MSKGVNGFGRILSSLRLPGAAFALALLLAGCARPPLPGTDEVPAGLPTHSGIYADVGPRWSHDGRHIAFLRVRPDRTLQLFLADAGLSRPLALLEPDLVEPDRGYSPGRERYTSPDTLAWSPHDRQIAFERAEEFTFDNGDHLFGTGLWSLDLPSGRVFPLALHPKDYFEPFYYYRAPHWSPDGRYLAFLGEGIHGERCLLIHPLAGQKPQEVTAHFDNYEESDWPAWEPPAVGGPESLVYRQTIRRTPAVPSTETLRRICPGSADGTATGEILRVTAQDYARQLPAQETSQTVVPRVGHLAWSPNGRWLAFTLTPDGNNFGRYELWIVNNAGQGARRVSPRDRRGYFAPVWLDSGHLGALSPQGGRFDVVSVDIAARTARVLGVLPTADCDWSPDRTRIVYALPFADSPPDSRTATTLRILALTP